MVERFADIPRTEPSTEPGDLLRTTLALFPLGINLIAERLRIDHPSWTESRVQQQVSRTIAERGMDGWSHGFVVQSR